MDSDTVLMTLYVVLGLTVIFYCVVSFFSGKTWQVIHVLLVVGIFFASAVFCILACATLKTQQQWREHCAKQEAALVAKQEENASLLEGMVRNQRGEIEEAEDSIRSLKAQLGHQQYDRGRVWRDCSPGEFDGTSITVRVVPAEAEGEPPPHQLDKMIVYVFKEEESPDGWKLPGAYLGEFQVREATNVSVTLRPTLTLDTGQVAAIRSGGTWMLYEMMPVDSYHVFAELYEPEAGDPQAEYVAKLRTLMPQAKMNCAGAEYEALIAEYARDRRKTERDRDPTERIWKKVKFLKEPKAVEVDAEGGPVRFAQANFDPTGRAVPASLRLGEFNLKDNAFQPGLAEFDIGDMAIMDGETANKLIQDGVCEEVELFYRRELRDYAFLFHEIFSRVKDAEDSSARIHRDTQTLVVTHGGAVKQVTYRTGERGKLQADLEGFKHERDMVHALLTALQKQWTQLRTDLNLLYRTNNALAAELARIQTGTARAIDQRSQYTGSGAAVPSAPSVPRKRP